MRKSIFAAVTALCLMAGSEAFAQRAAKKPMTKQCPTVEQMAQRMTDRMSRELDLTEAQIKQVYEINLRQVQQMQALRRQMRESRQAEAEKMKGILSTEQFVEWARMQGPGPGAHHGKRMACGQGKACTDGPKCGKACDGTCPRGRK